MASAKRKKAAEPTGEGAPKADGSRVREAGQLLLEALDRKARARQQVSAAAEQKASTAFEED